MDYLPYILHSLIFLEIVLTGGLLWLLFYLDEQQSTLKPRMSCWIKQIQGYKELLSTVKESCFQIRVEQAKAMGKWTFSSKLVVSVLEKISSQIAKNHA